ncbi:DUF1990 family protein [Pseudarthrobacter sp. P1]|uniref:DUF1990 family protein n=1 Tax=Pseudarthrobacter sp. P1 TaxID=3418418 RepID=UPI003CF29FF9
MDSRDRRAALTYPQIGLTHALATAPTGDIHWPPGYRGVDIVLRVGTGPEDFRALAEGILGWEIQRRAGLTVRAEARARVGGRVVSGFGVGLLRLPVPCEVVWTEAGGGTDGTRVDAGAGPRAAGEPALAGFGYGTLPGHPARGEEAFVATLAADGAVHFRLLAFSRPAGLVFTLGAPVTRLTQQFVTKSYLAAAKSLVADSRKARRHV